MAPHFYPRSEYCSMLRACYRSAKRYLFYSTASDFRKVVSLEIVYVLFLKEGFYSLSYDTRESTD